METKLFIDDVRNPPTDEWAVARSFSEAMNYMLEHGCPQYISFDHDLGIGPSGYDIADWMVDMDLDNDGFAIPDDFDYTVHSANPVGKSNIQALITGYLAFRKHNV